MSEETNPPDFGPRIPRVEGDGFWVDHDMACAVCGENHAVIHMQSGVFDPCWGCQKLGWKTSHKKRWRCKLGRHKFKEQDSSWTAIPPWLRSGTNAECSSCGEKTWINWPTHCKCGHPDTQHIGFMENACSIKGCNCNMFRANG